MAELGTQENQKNGTADENADALICNYIYFKHLHIVFLTPVRNCATQPNWMLGAPPSPRFCFCG
jgi:hypothetical protein